MYLLPWVHTPTPLSGRTVWPSFWPPALAYGLQEALKVWEQASGASLGRSSGTARHISVHRLYHIYTRDIEADWNISGTKI